MPPQNNQPDNHSYDFILAAEEPIQQPFWSRLNKKRLLLTVLAVAAALSIIGAVVSTVQQKASAAQLERLQQIAALQLDIIRVAKFRDDASTAAQTKQRAASIEEGLVKSLGQTKNMLTVRDPKFDQARLTAAGDSVAIKKQLEQAKQYGSYSKTLDKALDKKLTNYQQSLLVAEAKGSKLEKATLKTEYEQANAMLGLVDEN